MPIMLVLGNFPMPEMAAWVWLGRKRRFLRTVDVVTLLRIETFDSFPT